MKIRRIAFVFCSILLAALSGCIETPDASQFHAPTISVSVASPSRESVTIVCQLSKGAHPSKITFRLSKSQSMSDAIETTVSGGVGESYSASFSGLEEGTQYYFDAEASGGRSSCRSSVGSFKTADAFDVDKDTKQINYQQQYVEFEVVSSIGLSVQIEDGADWVKESDTKVATKYRKTFLVDYNSSVEERTATIVFKSDAGGETRTVRIFQAGGPITIPDKNFKAYLVENFDKDGDGEIVLDEAKEVKEINVSTNEIKTLKGIEYFENVERIVAEGDGQRGALNELDLRGNTKLKWLYVTNNSLTSIDVSECTQLEILYFWDNNITNLDLSKNENLLDLRCARNDFSKAGLVVSGNKKLQYLYVDNTKLSHIDLSKNVELLEIGVYDNNLSSLDLSHNTKLYHVHASHNQLTQINLSALGSLKTCYCYNNHIKAIDLKNNPLLEQVNFNTNKIESIDVSNNPELTLLEVGANNVASLDISNNRKLVEISVGTNPISTLNTENNTLLETLIFDNTDITEFNVSHLKKLKKIWAHSTHITNLDLTENTELEELDISWTDLSSIDLTKNNKLKTLKAQSNRPLLVYLNDMSSIETLEVNENVDIVSDDTDIAIPDANFKRYLVEHFDKDGDGKISIGEARVVESIDVCTDDIVTLEGIENFPKLRHLSACGSWTGVSNGKLRSLDVSKNTALIELACYDNPPLTILDVSKNTALTDLRCYSNQINNLDVSKNTALKELNCDNNQLTNLDLTKNTALELLQCSQNQLTVLDVSKNIALKELYCHDNQLRALNVSNTALTRLECYNNQLTSLDVSKNIALKELNCDNNQLTNLDLTKNTALTSLLCENNQLANLDVSRNTSLFELKCYANQLANLDVSKNTALTLLYCGGNQMTSLDVSSNVALTNMRCENSKLTSLDVSKNTALEELNCNGNPDLSMVWIASGQNINDLNYDSSVTKLVHKDDKVNIPDANFKRYLVQNFDKDGDGEISMFEAESIREIHVCTDDIATLEGIEYFTKLYYLDVCGTGDDIAGKWISNGKLSSLDVSRNTTLRDVYCENNQLTSLDVSKNIDLIELRCQGNRLNTLDVSRNTILDLLYCENNQLTSLDVSKNTSLTDFRCEKNQLTSLDVSNNTALDWLYCYGNPDLAVVWIAPGQNIGNLAYDSSVTKLVHKDDKVNIPDANFKRYLVENFDKNGNGEIEYTEAYEISHIGCTRLNIRSLVGVESMVQLVDINCNENNLSEINLSANTKLTHLSCADNNLTSLDLQYNKSLVYLHCFSNQLTSLDVSNNTSLNVLNCTDNRNMTVLWLANGQVINDLSYDQNITTIRYK